jgi:DNA-binding transcriptional ArsR family regulator
MPLPQLYWDWGTAYDLFVSLAVLHKPAEFGVRGAWAAGVRARIPAPQRETLEQSQLLLDVPFHWIYSLPEPKDGDTLLWALAQVPPAQRLPVLALAPHWPPGDMAATLSAVAERGTWVERELELVRAAYRQEYAGHDKKSRGELASLLDLWARARDFGERYLEALSVYHEVFFAEEERRIRPALRVALAQAQELAGQMDLLDLLEELSQGVHYEEWTGAPELVLAPSYWCTPLMYLGAVTARCELRLFGARPPDSSLVPGEAVPDALMRSLKALSDPSRLRILHYLAQEPLTPAQLSRRLRLRVPTVIHHLKILRLAGLVQLSVSDRKEERLYAARPEAVTTAFHSLRGFLGTGQDTMGASPAPVREGEHNASQVESAIGR